MNLPFKRDEKTALDLQIDAILQEMEKIGVKSDEYPKMVTYLERLHELKAEERRPPVSRDTIALIAGNLAGILLIVAYEQKHVMNSKALPQILRPRPEKTNILK